MAKRIAKWAMGVLCLLVWAYIIVYITFISRNVTEYATYRLEIFWCLKEAWAYKNSVNWFFIVGNILLFMPLGFMLPLFFDKLRRFYLVGIIGIVISSAIEISQLICHRGLFEFDDIFNNGLGALLGYGIFELAISLFDKEHEENGLERAFLILIWVGLTGFLAFSMIKGQPVFDYLLARVRMIFLKLGD